MSGFMEILNWVDKMYRHKVLAIWKYVVFTKTEVFLRYEQISDLNHHRICSTGAIYLSHTPNESLFSALSLKKKIKLIGPSTVDIFDSECIMLFQKRAVICDTNPCSTPCNSKTEDDKNAPSFGGSSTQLKVYSDIYYVHMVLAVHFL